MTDEFVLPKIEEATLPEVDSSLSGGGFEGDFAEVLKKANAPRPTREVPPLHPKTVNISDEEMKEISDAKNSRQLFSNPKKKMRCEVGLFDLGDEEQRDAYQCMIDNCLQKGWLLARDDWQRTPEGGAFAAVKVLIPESRRNKGKKKSS